MKPRELIAKIKKAARAQDLDFEFVRQGKGSHELWQCGSTPVTIPQHREINEMTAEGICKRLEGELGERWWR